MSAIKAVLAKVGDGQWLPFTHEHMLTLNVGTLLVALAETRVFSVELRDKPLSMCVVKVCASESDEAPSSDEENDAPMLKGAKTLGSLVDGKKLMEGKSYLYIRVVLLAGGEYGTSGPLRRLKAGLKMATRARRAGRSPTS